MQSNRYLWLDLIRALSAILVCAGHLRAAIFYSFSTGNVDSNLMSIPFYFLTSLGHEAVIIFFVLSGFFVGGSLLTKKNEKFLFAKYFIIRISRLWIVLIPALFFTYIIDAFISKSILDGGFITSLNSGPNLDYSNSFLTLIYNTLFLQTIISPVFGSNGPLWSLANEFWYYITFPLLLYFIGFLKSNENLFLPYKIFCICFILFLGTVHMLEGFLVWLLGAIIFICNKNNIVKNFNRFHKFLLLSQFFIFLLFHKLNYTFMSDFFLALSFSLFLLTMLAIKEDVILGERVKRVILMLSEMSYSLYLFHFPVVLLIYSLFFTNSKLNFDLLGVLIFFLLLSLLLLIGFLAWLCFERHSFKLRLIMLGLYKKKIKESVS